MISLDRWHELTGGASVEEAARVAQVHRTTAARWRVRGNVPPAVTALLHFHLQGLLPPAAGAAWAGWRFHAGLLYAPDLRHGFTPEEIRCIVWWRQMESWRAARAAPYQREATQAQSAAAGSTSP